MGRRTLRSNKKIIEKKEKRKGGLKPKKGTKVKKQSVKYLSHFLRIYKGLNDWHLPIFTEVKEFCGDINTVLYPGCDKHLSASLVFSNVTYLDFNPKMEPFFSDSAIHSWIEDNRKYTDSPTINFQNIDYMKFFAQNTSNFDLVISASAGLISNSPCLEFLRPSGHFLVSDAHFDARNVFTKANFNLIGVYNPNIKKLEIDKVSLEGHFITTENKKITKEQVSESISKPKNKRSFKLKKEAQFMFYLFKKIK
ncbi:unnamed protein product [Dimorphilus gyrociliatus]|uniref:Uncharacterized protein n=1 Tax=Dimorphilus gyrociliatus TaxID=2664684 RepID=A0A7I8WED9_9ANNE|nr:unnamed protein product [Dimorphilus gyrociliatus]